MASVQVVGASKVFAGGVTAVREVTLDITDGELIVLVGPSGSGKSTLLRLIAGLERPSAGHIFIGGRDVTNLPASRRDIAMVFQNYALYPHMTVAQNLGFVLKIRRTPKAEIRRRVEETAATLGLESLLARKPAQLSGGQRQRVAMGRAMVRDPQVLLLDEPLSNLDAALRAEMRTELKRIHYLTGTTSVFVTHDQVEAMTLGDRVAVLRDGVLEQEDSPLGLYRDPANTFIAGFIGSPAMNLLDAAVERGAVRIGGQRFTLSPEIDLSPYEARSIIVGIRPSDFEDASLAGNGSNLTIEAKVEVIEELGREVHLRFSVDGIAASAGPGGGSNGPPRQEHPLSPERAAVGPPLTAIVDPHTRARRGFPIRLSVDPATFYFFEKESGRAIGRSGSQRTLEAPDQNLRHRA
jgi:multiple sugar transport system ATP-binding protein